MPVNPEAFKRLRTIQEALAVTEADLRGPILRRLGQIHRKQERRIFASEGAEGAFGKWAALSPGYAAAKTRMLGTRGKILVLSGETKDRFLSASRAEYVQRYIKPFMQFGARSEVAGFHFRGSGRLPRRDPVSKTARMLEELRQGIVAWYRNERLPQVLRGAARLSQ